MKKAVLISFIAVLAIFLISFSSAADVADNVRIKLNDGDINDEFSFDAGEMVPVAITFNSLVNGSVDIEVELKGCGEDVSAVRENVIVLEGKEKIVKMNLEFPRDIDDRTEDCSVHVTISSSKGTGYTHKSWDFTLNRKAENFEVLSVDYDNEVAAGEVIPVAIVIKNTGYYNLDDGYILVSIDDLQISKRVYFGDLVYIEDDDNGEDDEDAIARTVYLQVPENAENGVYEMNIKVYNKDTSTIVRKLINVEGVASTQVLAAVKSQDMKAGETKTYDLIIVNSGSKVRVYNLQTISGTGLIVSAPSVVTVGSDSSVTIPVSVSASSGMAVGSYTFNVNVDGQEVVFGVNITSGKASSGIVALTVVLVIVFVVLLIVLIVLLTRREKPTEEAETSYY